jgi:hypothetical protein
MFKAPDIGKIGEQLAAAWLGANGWQCYRNTQLPGATDIQGTRGKESILVQVKTAVYPNSPIFLSSVEKQAIVARANHNQAGAWLARLQIDNEGRLFGNIAWTKLN